MLCLCMGCVALQPNPLEVAAQDFFLFCTCVYAHVHLYLSSWAAEFALHFDNFLTIRVELLDSLDENMENYDES